MHIVGIDEAGRGALAGPIVVAAVSIPKGFYPRVATLPRLKDSKKLSPLQRLAWFELIKSHPQITYSTARIYPRKIEKINIANCANLAAQKVFERITSRFYFLDPKFSVLLDGSLYLGDKASQPRFAKTIIRGDEKITVIKLASIVAKVTRDRYMMKLHRRHPDYHLHLHKGYGTLAHRRMIRRHGPAEIHRLTYLKNYRRLAKV